METNKTYYVGVRFDEKDKHPVICNGGKIFNSYESCRHDTVDNAEVMRIIPIPTDPDTLTAVKNITNALQEEMHKLDQQLMDFRNKEPSAFWGANILIRQVQKETFEKAITIAKTCF